MRPAGRVFETPGLDYQIYLCSQYLLQRCSQNLTVMHFVGIESSQFKCFDDLVGNPYLGPFLGVP